MRTLCLWMVMAVVVVGCGSSGGGGGNSGGAGGATSGTGGQGGQAGRAGTGGAAGATATGGSSGAGGTVSHSGGAGGHGGTTSATGGSGSGGAGGKGGAGGGGGGHGGGMGSGGNGGSGMVCGGLQGRVCGTDQWCDFNGTCGAGDQTGMCQPQQVGGALCAPSPVCGCDGKTYPSACSAHLAGMDTMPTNACITGNGGAGAPCAVDTDCATGFKCCITGGTVSSPIACRQVAAGSQCPALP